METEAREGETVLRPTVEGVFARIERESICPRPRWHFLAQESAVWALGATSVGVGALALAGTLFKLRNTWWEAHMATHESFADFFVDALPYAWLVIFILFLYSAYWSLCATKRGYRYPFALVVVGTLATTGVCGIILYQQGAGKYVDERVGAYMPFHRSLMAREREVWMKPTEGRIAGIVREIPFGESVLWIEGVDGEPYQIVMELPSGDRVQLRQGEHVRIAGVPTTTVGLMEGCILFQRHDDVLRGAHRSPIQALEVTKLGDSERKVFLGRSTKCKEISSYVRFSQQGN